MRQAIVAALRRLGSGAARCGCVLEIATDAPEMLRIPWELMALPLDEGDGEAGFLFLGADVALVRQLRGLACICR